MWKIDEPCRRPADEDRYESWTTMARREEDGKCAFGFAATKEQAEECLRKDIASIEEFERLAPLKRVEKILSKYQGNNYMNLHEATDAIRAIYEELKKHESRSRSSYI